MNSFKIISIITYLLCINLSGQSNHFTINNVEFHFETEKIDTLEGAEFETATLYRNDKKLLTHTLIRQEGDCSSVSIELGKYVIDDAKIIFYSYWAIADRMPSRLIPFGFRKQVYTVDRAGKLNLINSVIYIEDFIENQLGKDKFYHPKNNWFHIGLDYLNQPTKNEFEKEALQDYIQTIEKKYNSKFVLNKEKELLESEVRAKLDKQIEQNTGNWIDGEIFGKVKK